jgi:hypothetical protein
MPQSEKNNQWSKPFNHYGQKNGATSRNWIMTTSAQRLAPTDPLNRLPSTSHPTKSLYRFKAIVRTRWSEAAGATDERGKGYFVCSV